MEQIPTKFIQEIKDNWLQALKSGKFKQGFCDLYIPEENAHCCIGVLGAVTPGLDNSQEEVESCPYTFLENTIGRELESELWKTNDKDSYDRKYPRDYSNVIPLIEALPVQE